MAVAIRSSASSSIVGTGTTVTVNKPTGLAVGDVMIATVFMNSAAGGSGPSGWDTLASNDFVSNSVWGKVADASDVAASNFTWTSNNSGNAKVAGITAFTGANYDNIQISSLSAPTNSSSPTFTNGLTPAVASSMLILSIQDININAGTLATFAITTSDPGGWAAGVNTTRAGSVGVTMATAIRVETTATGSYSCTNTDGDTTESYFGWMLALPPQTGPTNAKTINGLAMASVKTANGLAISSVETVNGLT